ncbi:MAG: type I-C CRISPR-associated protein Cas5c [Lysobacteraceae bacterium]
MTTHTLEVWGDFACFTRPEMKVERFSYPVITPSAARGIFDAIYWDGKREKDGIRPYFYWQITRIEVLEAPRYIALRRNEVKDIVPGTSVLNKWMSGESSPEPLWADGGKDELGTDQKGRTQRQTMALKNVRYRLHARIVPKSGNDSAKLNACFVRRARQGKCFQQPYFGCREFPAFFEYLDPAQAEATPAPLALDQNFGLMLYDVFDLGCELVGDKHPPAISLFEAHMVRGVIEVPAYTSATVKKAWSA